MYKAYGTHTHNASRIREDDEKRTKILRWFSRIYSLYMFKQGEKTKIRPGTTISSGPYLCEVLVGVANPHCFRLLAGCVAQVGEEQDRSGNHHSSDCISAKDEQGNDGGEGKSDGDSVQNLHSVKSLSWKRLFAA